MGWQEAGRTRAGRAGSRSGCAPALPSPARPGPAHPRCPPRSLGRGAAPGPDVCSAWAASPLAPLPAAGRVRALRLLRASDSDYCSRSEAARAQGALQASGAAPGVAVLHGSGHVDSGQPRSRPASSARSPRSRRRC